jgi:hypothetical protein
MATPISPFASIATPKDLVARGRAERSGLPSNVAFGASAGGALRDIFGRVASGVTGKPVGEFARAREQKRIGVESQNRISELVAGGMSTDDATTLVLVDAAAKFASIGSFKEAAAMREQITARRRAKEDHELRIAGLKQTRLTSAATQQNQESARIQRELPDPINIKVIETGEQLNALRDDETGVVTFVDSVDGVTERSLSPGQYVEIKLQGGAEAISPGQKLRVDATQQVAGTSHLLGKLATIRQALQEDPSSATFATRVFAEVNNIGKNARALLDRQGFNRAEISKMQDRVFTRLDKAGVTDNVMQSRVMDIVFAIAAARENGRFSDRDIDAAAVTLGAKSADFRARIAALDELAINVFDRANIGAEAAEIDPSHIALSRMATRFGEYQALRDAFPVPIPGRPETGSLNERGQSPLELLNERLKSGTPPAGT